MVGPELPAPWLTLPPDHVRVEQEAQLHTLFQAVSMPVRLPGDSQVQRMSLFSHLTVQEAAVEAPVDLASDEDAPPAPATTFLVDGLCHCGGLVWALDWCPAHTRPSAPPPDLEVLAAAVHPGGQQRTRLGAPLHGPAGIQLWGVARSSATPWHRSGEPQMLACLLHAGRVTWDVKWCPDARQLLLGCDPGPGPGPGPGPDDHVGLRCMGLLAAVLGDGAVCVYAVPHHEHLRQLARQQKQQREASRAPAPGGSSRAAEPPAARAALALHLTPVASLDAGALSGSLVRRCEWHPAAPHTQLLLGCWDGTAVVCQLHPQSGNKLRLLQHIKADSGTLHAVQWMPPPPPQPPDTPDEHKDEGEEPPAPDTSYTQYYLTAGLGGEVKVWQLLDPVAPVYQRVVLRSVVYDVAWTANPPGWYMAFDDGVLRRVMLGTDKAPALGSTSTINFQGAAPVCLRALSACPPARALAYVGDDGLLALCPMVDQVNPRKRCPHVALGAVAVDDGTAWVLRAQDIPGNGGLFAGHDAHGGADKDEQREAAAGTAGALTDERQALHCVRFGREVRGGVWLAAGGAAGLLRLLFVRPSIPRYARQRDASS